VASKQTTWQRGAPSYQRRGSPDEQALYQTGVSEFGAENVVANRNAWAVRCQFESSMAARRSLLNNGPWDFALDQREFRRPNCSKGPLLQKWLL
jgi:hypothetical protein